MKEKGNIYSFKKWLFLFITTLIRKSYFCNKNVRYCRNDFTWYGMSPKAASVEPILFKITSH